MAGEGHGGLSPNVFSSLVHLPSPPGAQSCPFSLPPPQDSLEGQRSPSEAWRSAFPVSSPAVCLACLLSLKEFLFLSSSCWPGERQPLLFLPPGIGSPTDRGLGYRASALCCALSGPLMSRCPLFSVAPTGRGRLLLPLGLRCVTQPFLLEMQGERDDGGSNGRRLWGCICGDVFPSALWSHACVGKEKGGRGRDGLQVSDLAWGWCPASSSFAFVLTTFPGDACSLPSSLSQVHPVARLSGTCRPSCPEPDPREEEKSQRHTAWPLSPSSVRLSTGLRRSLWDQKQSLESIREGIVSAEAK